MILLDYGNPRIPEAYNRLLDGPTEKELRAALRRVAGAQIIHCACGKTVAVYKGAIVLEACDNRVAIFRYRSVGWIPWSVADGGAWLQQKDPLDMPAYTGIWLTPHVHAQYDIAQTTSLKLAWEDGIALDSASVKQVVRYELCLQCNNPIIADYSNVVAYDARILSGRELAERHAAFWARIDTVEPESYTLHIAATTIEEASYYVTQHECGGRQ